MTSSSVDRSLPLANVTFSLIIKRLDDLGFEV